MWPMTVAFALPASKVTRLPTAMGSDAGGGLWGSFLLGTTTLDNFTIAG